MNKDELTAELKELWRTGIAYGVVPLAPIDRQSREEQKALDEMNASINRIVSAYVAVSSQRDYNVTKNNILEQKCAGLEKELDSALKEVERLKALSEPKKRFRRKKKEVLHE